MQVTDVSVREVLGGRLARDGFAVLLLPGGFAPHFSDALGEAGEAIIQQFVSSGGGFVGICAGAYYGVWAGLLPAEIFDIAHWKRGSTDRCEIAWTSAGASSVGAPPRRLFATATGPFCAAPARRRAASATL